MYRFKAKVISGRGRGAKIGFPTANLAPANLPIAYGVYLAKIRLNRKSYQALLHYGPRKTFGQPLSLEAHLKNFKGNIYGRTLEIEVDRKIRQVKKFKNAVELKKQIQIDLMELEKP